MNIFQRFLSWLLSHFKKPKKLELEEVTRIEVNGKLIKKLTKEKFKGYCEFCKKNVPYKFDRFYCSYCKKWHCEKHRLPEKHFCSGKPKSPPGAFREIHTKNGIIVNGK